MIAVCVPVSIKLSQPVLSTSLFTTMHHVFDLLFLVDKKKKNGSQNEN